jgi:hypothetical protein
MSNVSVEVVGETHVRVAMEGIKDSLQRRLVRGALTAAARIIAKEMKRLAPRDTWTNTSLESR